MPDRLPTPSSSPQQDPSQDGSQQRTDPDSATAPTSGAQRPEGAEQPGDTARPGQDGQDNPFAPPPEGAPDRPWQPRRQDGEDQDRSGGGRWSSRQPGRSSGPFGQRPGTPEGQNGQGGPGGLRWDPTDPAQRRARYALLAGMWGFFFALFGWPYVALLLGSLAIYWAVSSLRARPAGPERGTAADSAPASAPVQGGAQQNTGKPQTTAAVAGLVTAGLALAMVAATFTAQIVYRDYYTCVNDALTTTAQKSCEELLPEQLRSFLSPQE